MNGILLYNENDYKNNVTYVAWLIEEAKKRGLSLDLLLKEDFLMNGLRNRDIDFIVNRTRSYEISIIFELNNIRVFNNSSISLLGNNKLSAYKYASDKGYPYPKVHTSWGHDFKLISKPNDLHGGQGIDLLENVDLGDGYMRFQQDFMSEIYGDIRFYIINNKVIHGVLRKAKGKIISNFTQGGEIEYYKFSEEEKIYVENFIGDIKVDYAGIDFFLTKDKALIFNEIEDVVGSRMLSQLGINDTTDLYLDHILKEMGKE